MGYACFYFYSIALTICIVLIEYGFTAFWLEPWVVLLLQTFDYALLLNFRRFDSKKVKLKHFKIICYLFS